jgi:hypothetical protein
MRFSICAAAVVVASIVGEGIASPVQARSDKKLAFGERKTVGRAEPTREEREAMKYFHEPGYVLLRSRFRHTRLPSRICPDALPCNHNSTIKTWLAWRTD